MEFINKIEVTVGGWLKSVPHLPAGAQKWLGKNVWWIALIGAILTGLGILISIAAVFGALALLAAVSDATYPAYAAVGVTGLTIVALVVALAFTIVRGVILAMSVKPLKAMEKKGWTLLFVLLLIQAVSVVLNAVLSFSVGGFFVGIIFGGIGLAIGAYFLYEIRGQFAHATKAAAAPAKKKAAKKA